MSVGALTPITRWTVMNNGAVVPGAKLYSYLSGTSTPSPLYNNADLDPSHAHANPVVADANGTFPVIYLAALSYRFLITDANGVTVFPAQDNVYDFAELQFSASGGSALIGYIQAGAGAVARTVQGRLRDLFSVKDFGAVGDGTTNDASAFIACEAALTAGGEMFVPAGVYRIGTNTTIGADVTLRFTGSVTVDTGVTLSLNGPVDAPLSQVFAGLGTVAFGNGHLGPIYPQWWGALGNNSHDDTAAIQAAVNALPSIGGTVHLPEGQYVTSSLITLNAGTHRGLTLSGAGSGTILKPATAINCLKLTGDAGGAEVVTLRDLRIIAGTAHASNLGILIDNGASGQSNWVLERLSIIGDSAPGQFSYLGTGISCVFALKGTIRDCVIEFWNKGILYAASGGNHSNANLIEGCKIRINNTGADLVQQTGTVVGCTLEANGTSLICNGTNVLCVVGNHFEGSGPGTLTGISGTGGSLTTVGNTFLSHTANRDVVTSGNCAWSSIGDYLATGVTRGATTLAYQYAKQSSGITVPSGTVAMDGNLLTHNSYLGSPSSSGAAILTLMKINASNRAQLGDGFEIAGAAGAPTGTYLRFAQPDGTLVKIALLADS